MHGHFQPRPVERDCICLERKLDGPHIAACNRAFREKFFGTWRSVRAAFGADSADRRRLDTSRQAALN